jgi:hypothetical protein
MALSGVAMQYPYLNVILWISNELCVGEEDIGHIEHGLLQPLELLNTLRLFKRGFNTARVP